MFICTTCICHAVYRAFRASAFCAPDDCNHRRPSMTCSKLCSDPRQPSGIVVVGGHFGYRWLRLANGTIAADDAFSLNDPYLEGQQIRPFKPLLPATHVVLHRRHSLSHLCTALTSRPDVGLCRLSYCCADHFCERSSVSCGLSLEPPSAKLPS